MNDVQKNLLKLIKEIDEMCKACGVEYYLGGGTALGAVRHGGFLPWDDDADLYITRDNWNKLLAHIDEVMPERRELVCDERFPTYRNPIARYMDLDTTWIYQSQMFCGTPLGQHVEFLILDPIDPSWDETEYLKLFAVYAELLGRYFVVNRDTANKSSVFDKELFDVYQKRVKAEGEEAVLRELADKLLTYPDTDEVTTYHLRHGVEVHNYTRAFFGKPRYVPYEDTMLPVAEKAEAVFRQAYGDSWKMVPPVEEQVVHRSVNDLNRSYEECVSEYSKMIDIDHALQLNKDWKDTGVKRLIPREQMLYARNASFAQLDVLEIQAAFSGKESFSDEDFDKYYAMQAKRDMIEHGTIADVPAELKKGAVLCFLKRGEYWKSAKLLRIFGEEETQALGLEDAARAIDDSRAIDALLDLCQREEAAQVAASALKENPELGDVSPLYTHGVLAGKRAAGTCEASDVFRARLRFKDYPYFHFMQLTWFESQQPSAVTAQNLLKLADSTSNGIVALKAREVASELAAGSEDVAAAIEAYQQAQGEASQVNRTATAQVLGDLVAKVQDVCDEQGISCLVWGETLLSVLKTGDIAPGARMARMAIHAKDAHKLHNALNALDSEKYFCESWLNNKEWPAFSLRFSDITTTSITSEAFDPYTCHGLYVQIELLRPLVSDDGLRKKENRKQLFWHAMTDPEFIWIVERRAGHEAAEAIRKGIAKLKKKNLFRVKSIGTRMFEGFVEDASRASNTLTYFEPVLSKNLSFTKNPKLKGFNLSASYLQQRLKLQTDAGEWYVPAEYDSFMRETKSELWRLGDGGIRQNVAASCWVSTTVPSAVSSSAFRSSPFMSGAASDARHGYDVLFREGLQGYVDLGKCRKAVREVNATLYLGHRYEDLADSILAAFACEDWAVLDDLFAEYEEGLSKKVDPKVLPESLRGCYLALLEHREWNAMRDYLAGAYSA
ncbi:MAG: phosphorylcholine transferase LicD [Eggerthellaceae bacterium]